MSIFSNFSKLVASSAILLSLSSTPLSAGLIAHYTFDAAYTEESETRTADSVGSGNYARLGTRVEINTTSALIGAGTLEMNGGNGGTATGALTNNTFTWASDARTVSFWYKSDNIGPSTNSGTFVGMGVDSAGQRFDIKEFGASAVDLRVEIAGGGTNSQADIHNQQWHHIAIVIPNDATLNDVVGYVDGVLVTDFNPGTVGANPINTAASQLLFGSTVSSTSGGRVPVGLMDDLQIYDEVLTQEQIQAIYNSVIGASDPKIASFTAVGGGVWELTLEGVAGTKYEFRSSTTLEFTPGTLVSPLSQANPGTDPGSVDVSGDFVTTDSNGVATVRLTLTGNPRDFVRGVSLP